MGLSHVLFTAVNGSRHWGPLPFTLGPLGDGGVGGWGGVMCGVAGAHGEIEGEYSREDLLRATSWCVAIES